MRFGTGTKHLKWDGRSKLVTFHLALTRVIAFSGSVPNTSKDFWWHLRRWLYSLHNRGWPAKSKWEKKRTLKLFPVWAVVFMPHMTFLYHLSSIKSPNGMHMLLLNPSLIDAAIAAVLLCKFCIQHQNWELKRMGGNKREPKNCREWYQTYQNSRAALTSALFLSLLSAGTDGWAVSKSCSKSLTLRIATCTTSLTQPAFPDAQTHLDFRSWRQVIIPRP